MGRPFDRTHMTDYIMIKSHFVSGKLDLAAIGQLTCSSSTKKNQVVNPSFLELIKSMHTKTIGSQENV